MHQILLYKKQRIFMKKCIGCGAMIQTDHPEERGYARALDHDLCQSCFRLKHYRDFKHVKAEVNDGDTLEFIHNFDGHVLWVVDVMNLSQSLHEGLLRALSKKNVVMLVNKRDLLSKSVSDRKLKQSIMRLLKDYHISLMDVLFVSAFKSRTLEPVIPYLEDASCAFVGCINAGKSSLLNALLKKDQLSVSPVASTTADVIHLENDQYDVYDTPGFNFETELTSKLSDEMLVLLSPKKEIRPAVYQIYEPQALIIGNLGAIIIEPIKNVIVMSYLPFKLKRVKPERVSANLALEHEFMIDNADYKKRRWPKQAGRIDLEIFDVGFISIDGEYRILETVMDKSAEVIIRKAII